MRIRIMKKHMESGSSLLLVVLILLVLSGFGAAVLTLTDSDRTDVSQDDHLKDALYVAEMGLRVGESTLFATNPTNSSTLLQHVSTAQTAAVSPAIPVFPQAVEDYDLSRLGTYLTNASGQELANQRLNIPGSPTGKATTRAFYSLYVRNNPADTSVADGNPATVAEVDNDTILNLVSVGWVTQGGRILSVKILEEEYRWIGTPETLQSQIGGNEAGTGTAQIGRS